MVILIGGGMKDSADIRKINKNKILKILWRGGQYTKQQLSVQTGLSIATCNTLLNELEQSHEVVGEKRRLQDVGRESVCYQINEGFESFLCIYFEFYNGEKHLILHLLSPVGNILEKINKKYELIDYPVIANEVEIIRKRYNNISQIIVGTPSIAENGIIRHCDIIELENVELVIQLEQQFHIPVYLENDMHLKAYGYYSKCGKANEIITLANFPSHILPGTASIHAGMILKGKNQFAGMVGFLPYEMDREKELEQLGKETCRPFVSKAVTSIITIINPGIVVLTGDLLSKDSLDWIRNDCLQYIPNEYMPTFIYETNLNTFYLEGMYQKALDLKGVIK